MLVDLLLPFLKSDAVKHGQRRVFVKLWVGFGQLAQNKNAAFGAFYNLNVLASGTKPNRK